MLLEDLVLLGVVLAVSAVIARPAYKLYRRIVPAERDPVSEAKERLETARKQAEAARLNKEADHIIEEMYDEELGESAQEQQPQDTKEHLK